MSQGNLLSDNAVRQISRIGLKVRQLEQRLGMGTNVNQRRNQIYARIDEWVEDNKYIGTQVIAGSNGVIDVEPPGALEFDGTNAPYIYAIDNYDGDATGVVPVWQASDGEEGFWEFQVAGFSHPFKVTKKSSLTITVGANRAEAVYRFDDIINIIDGENGKIEHISYPTAEDLVVVSGDNYIYYELSHSISSGWTSILKKTATWPPTDITTNPQKLFYLIALVQASTEIDSIGQLSFSDPTLWTRSFTTSFAPIYGTDQLQITAGTVEVVDGDGKATLAIPAATFATTTNLYLYIVVTANGYGANPTITATIQSSATKPTFHTLDGNNVIIRNHVLGFIEGTTGIYTPYHLGDVTMDLSRPDELVRVDISDTTAGYLEDKLIDGEATEVLSTDKGAGDLALTIDVKAKNSIEIDAAELQLDGDILAPTAHSMYGTNAAGVKTFNAFTQVTYISDIQISGTNLQVKTQTAYVLDPGTLSGWSTVSGWTGTTC